MHHLGDGRAIRLAYEDLMRDPAAALARFSTTLAADPSPLIDQLAAGRSLVAGHVMAGNRLRMEGSLLLRPDLDWQHQLPAGQRRLFEHLCRPLLRRYGYLAAPVGMRAAFLLPSLAAGGAQRQFALLAQNMAARGHEVLFVTCVPGGPYWNELAAADGVRLVALAERDRTSHLGIGRRLPVMSWRLARLLRQNRTEIVYSALHIANLLAWLATGGGRTVALCWGIRAAHQDLVWRQRLPYELCRLLSGSVDLLVANSSAGLNAYRECGYRPRHAEVIPNGIDVDRFRPDPLCRDQVRAEFGLAEAETAVGVVGRLVPVKDHPTFLAAAARLRGEHPQARFVLVGDGPSGYRRSLIDEAARLGLGGQIVWAGERADMARVYNGLDLLCLPSASEGFPNVLAEAMACGVPAVATDVGDARGILGDTGEVVPPREPAALASALAHSLVLSADRRRKMGEAARARIIARYAVPAMIARTEAALVEAIDRHRTSRGLGRIVAGASTSGGWSK